MTDNRERAIEQVANELGWTTEQVSYCTYSVMCMAVDQCEQKLDLLDALKAVEWSDDGRCPQCATWNFGSHQPECIVGSAIAKAERKG